ncbi:MAG: PAS domain S-box protein [Anaerolineaceae bacterium]
MKNNGVGVERRVAFIESETRYRRLFETAQDGILILDAKTGKITDVNPFLLKMLGYSYEEFLGKKFWEIGPFKDVKATRIAFQDLQEKDYICYENLPLKTKSGQLMDVEFVSNAFQVDSMRVIQCNIRDITDRVKEENALKEKFSTMSRLTTIVSDSNDAIILHDLDGKILAWNLGAKETYGYTEAEASGMNVRDIVAEPDRKAALSLIYRIKQGEIVKSFELRRVTKDGRILDVWLTTTLLTNEKGEPVAIASTERDITARKLAEELTRREFARSEALERTAIRLNAKLEPSSVIRTVCEEAVQALNVPAAWVNLYDRTRDVLVLADAVGLTPEFKLHYQPLSRTEYEKYARELGSISVNNDIQLFADIPNAEVFASIDARTLINASMYREGQLIGTLHIVTIGEIRQFRDVEITLIKGLAAQAAQAIANAQLYDISNQRLKNLDALRIIDLAIAGSLDLHLTLNIALEQIVSQLRIDAADVLLLNPNSQTLDFSAGRGFSTRAIEKSRVQIGEGFAGRSALNRQSIFFPNFSLTNTDFSRADLLSGENFVTYLAVPLIAKGEIKGVLEIFHRSPLEVTSEWKAFLETLGGQVAIAVDNAQLFSNLQRSNADLILAYDATIESLSHALDLRDKETEGHSNRVTEMTMNLARMMDMSDVDLIQVRRGALLHDIGKLGVPDGVLLKPNPLTEEEWVIMKQHVIHSYNILSPIAFLRPALDIPYCHHEKWDGSGYPRGIKGEQIPMAARLFAVVDVYDALTSDRPYRPAWTSEQALELIKQERGVHFDPQVVEMFLKMMDKPAPDPFAHFKK